MKQALITTCGWLSAVLLYMFALEACGLGAAYRG